MVLPRCADSGRSKRNDRRPPSKPRPLSIPVRIDSLRTLIIGDIHGCAREFEQLLSKVGFKPGSDVLYLTGDAFSRGPEPAEVWRLIRYTGAKMVLGNHDVRLAERLRRHVSGEPVSVRWSNQLKTLEALKAVSDTLASWLESLPFWIDEPRFLLVHAGINPEQGLEGTSQDELLTIRTWPPVKGIAGPRWHDAYEPSGKLIVFGHDAPGGLVVKRRDDGSPYVIGLDSGCIYGGQLSCYLLEEDRIEQVESLQDPAVFAR